MKKLFMLAIATAFTTATFAQSEGGELPSTNIKNVSSGQMLAFNQSIEKGKVTMVSFWATWCVPCKKEIKNVIANMEEWKEEADFNYVTVSIDESRSEGLVRSYAKAQGWEFPYFIDANGDLKRSLNFQTVPFTMIIDKEGKVAYAHQGYEEGGEYELFDKIKELSKK